MRDPILTVSNLHAGYGAFKVLHGVSIEVCEHEIVALLGANGVGKTTLLKCICGAVKPYSGEIRLKRNGDTISLTGKQPHEIARQGLTLVPEGRGLFPYLTVKENLLMGIYLRSSRKGFRERLKLIYELFPTLKERQKQLAGTLSGGEQQMLAIARGLVFNPRILLIDEPSLGLAPILVKEVFSKIKELREAFGLTLLIADQNFIRVAEIADRGYIMVRGEVVSSGAMSELRDHKLVREYYLRA